jgi:hypothetical protein
MNHQLRHPGLEAIDHGEQPAQEAGIALKRNAVEPVRMA